MSDFLLETFARFGALTDKKMHEYLQNGEIPENLRETMAYSVFAGGKKLRSTLLLAVNEYCNGNIEDALPFAAAMEFIHTYSLIHDDLPAMDNDDYRRGKLTSHKKFGEDRAILAGDGLLSYAFEIMLENADSAGKISAAKSIAYAAGVKGMVAGQWVDVTNNGTVYGRETAEYIHDRKTAAMLIGAVKAGAQCACADCGTVKNFEEYARLLGMCFQITDDILDVEGDERELGKPIGSDESNGKTTFVSIYGLDGAKKLAKEYAEKAKGIFKDARFFAELADWMTERKN